MSAWAWCGWWEVSGVSLSLPRLCLWREVSGPVPPTQSRPVCVGWCVVGGKRRVPLPPQIASAHSPGLCVGWCVVGGKRRVPSLPRLCQPVPGLFVLAGVWWEVSGVSLPSPDCTGPSPGLFVLAGLWWEVSGTCPFPPQIVSAPVLGLVWLVCGGR